MKTIIHLINNLRGGGAEKLLIQIVNKLTDQYNVVLLLLNDKDSVYRDQLSPKVYLHVLSNSSKYNAFLALKIYYFINKYQPVALHSHLFPSFYFAAIPYPKKILKIYTEHSTSNKRRNLIPFKLERLIYNRFDKIICISSGASKILKKYLDCDSINKRISTINNGISLPTNTKEKKLNIKKTYKVGMIGRFEPPKDQISLIKSAEYLQINVEFHFFGNGKNLDNAKSEAMKFKDHNFVFHGHINNINSQMSQMDICVVSSLWEGFGLSALESMALGVPTFGTNVEGLSNVIGSEKYLFECGDHRRIASLIDECLSDEKFYSEASIHAIMHSKNFNISDTIEAYRNLYI